MKMCHRLQTNEMRSNSGVLELQAVPRLLVQYRFVWISVMLFYLSSVGMVYLFGLNCNSDNTCNIIASRMLCYIEAGGETPVRATSLLVCLE
jgi:hypothetical protein